MNATRTLRLCCVRGRSGMAELGISTRVELVLYAVNNGDPRHAEWLAGTTRILPSV